MVAQVKRYGIASQDDGRANPWSDAQVDNAFFAASAPARTPQGANGVNEAPVASIRDQPVRVGTELLVNTATASSQNGQQLTVLSNGGFVVTWRDLSLGVGGASGDASNFAIKAQVYAADGTRIGTELLVNTATQSDQYEEQITALSNGGFVVTWTDASAGVGGATGDASSTAIKAQVFAADGSRIGSEVLVNTATASLQITQQIAALSNGGFVVTWTDASAGVGGATGDTSNNAIKAQVYAADGSRIGSELLINTATFNNQDAQQITALSNGGFVVTWTDASSGSGGATGDFSSNAVKAQIYAANGARIGTELLVNTATANNQSAQQITALSNGGFVVTWTDASAGVGGATGDTSGTAIKAQVYAADGSRTGTEVLVNTATANTQQGQQITALSNGGFVVIWSDFSAGVGGATGDASGVAVKAQIYAADGSRTGSELLVNTATAGTQAAQQITALSNGGFVVTWTDFSAGVGGATGDASGSAIKAQVYAADGSRIGSELLVNTATANSQDTPQIKGLPGGGFVVTWQDSSAGVGGATGDTSGIAIKAQIYSFAPGFATTEQVAISLKAQLNVSDVDAGAGQVTATVAVGYGIVTATAGTSGATVTGSGTAALTITGTLAQVNALLNSDATSTIAYNANTDAPPASTALTLTIDDGGNTGTGGAMSSTIVRSIAIASVNDAPSGTSSTVTGTEDTPLTLTAANFGFTDPDGNAFIAVRFTGLPSAAAGVLTDNGVAITVGQAISIADINAGNLVFTPAANVNGANVVGLSFTVQDDGGTGNGGNDTSATSTLTIALTAVNDAPVALLSPVVRVGTELLVNTATQGAQNAQQIAVLSGGGFVVTWTDLSLGVGGATGDNNGTAIKAQVYAADGTRVGTELLVNTATNGVQNAEQITALSNGGFVVTWTDGSAGLGGATGDASSTAIKAQVYAADGTRVGTELLVNTATANGQSVEQITALSNGGFVVTWVDNSFGIGGATGDTSSTAIKAQVYAADGSRIGSELLVNTATANAQQTQQITALSNGGFVVTWIDNSSGVGGATGDTSGTAIKAQVYAADGSRIGTELLVNTAIVNAQNAEQITALSNGGFVVTWTDNSLGVGGATGDTILTAIKAQVYAADGTRVGTELLVNTATANAQNAEQITALSGGGFVVTWTDFSVGVGGATGDNSNTAVKAQVYAADGTRVGTELLVNTATLNGQSGEQITALSGGGFVVTWIDGSAGTGGATGDNSSTAIKAQVYAADGTRVGTELLVNTAFVSTQNAQQIKALPGNGFVVTWVDASGGGGGATGDTSGTAIKAQIYTVAPTIAATEQVDLSLAGRFSVSDVDVASGTVTATITAGYGILTGTAGNSGATVSGSGTSTLTITGTQAQISGLLGYITTGTVVYNANSDTPPASTQLTFTVDDGGNTGSGGAQTATVLATVAITAINDAPVLATSGGATAFVEGTPVAVDPGLTVSDDVGIVQATVSITTGVGAEDVLAFTANPALYGNIAVDAGATDSSFTLRSAGGTATLAQWQAALRSVTYSDTSVSPTTTDRVVSITVSDGTLSSTTQTKTITVTAIDTAPVAVNDAALTNEAQALVIAVLANDTDVDGGPKNVATVNGVALTSGQLTTLASGATVILFANGTLGYNPNGAFNYLNAQSSTVEQFAYTLNGGSAATVSVTINGNASADDANHGSAGNDIVVGNGSFDVSQGGIDTVTGGAGNDGFFFGATLTAADTANGGGGNDSIGLSGNYTGGNALVLGAGTLSSIETIAVAAGSSYDITTNNANVAAGQVLTIYGSGLGVGDNLTFNGSAETDGRFVVYGGLGIDTITTGGGNDSIYFGRSGRFGPSDHVDGGAGSDTLALDGSYTVTISGSQVVNIETLALLDGGPTPAVYNITLADDWALPGETKTISFNTLRAGAVVDGHLEANANFIFYGGAGNDTITGGGGNDTLHGGLGADTLTGGAGADIFSYTAVAQSIGSSHDIIVGFNAGVDRIDLPGSVTAVEANRVGTASTSTLDADLTAALATLGANHAVQFTATGGDLVGHVFEVIDANGIAGYQAGQDFVIELQGTVTPITDPTTFI